MLKRYYKCFSRRFSSYWTYRFLLASSLPSSSLSRSLSLSLFFRGGGAGSAPAWIRAWREKNFNHFIPLFICSENKEQPLMGNERQPCLVSEKQLSLSNFRPFFENVCWDFCVSKHWYFFKLQYFESQNSKKIILDQLNFESRSRFFCWGWIKRMLDSCYRCRRFD